MASKKSMRFTGNRTAAIGLIVVCIVGTAILIAARSSESTSAAPAAPESTVAAAPATNAVPARTPKAATAPAAKPQSGEAAKAEETAVPATIEGCLVQDNETFRLKNTSGEDAPKGRSWKSGFIKKSSKTIELLDARRRVNRAP